MLSHCWFYSPGDAGLKLWECWVQNSHTSTLSSSMPTHKYIYTWESWDTRYIIHNPKIELFVICLFPEKVKCFVLACVSSWGSTLSYCLCARRAGAEVSLISCQITVASLHLLTPSVNRAKSLLLCFWGNFLFSLITISGVRGWGWGRRKDHTGLLSRPGCICSRGRWAGGTDGGEAKTLQAKQKREEV